MSFVPSRIPPGHFAAMVFLSAVPACGGDGFGPSAPDYFMLLQDAPCETSYGLPDTVMQPGHPIGSPNAGSGLIDGPPTRTILWVFGVSRLTGGVGNLSFMLVNRPSPLPVGTYPVRPLADSTVWLEAYQAPYAGAGFPTDMNTARASGTSFIVEPVTGSIVVEQSDTSGAAGTFSVKGSYWNDGVARCLVASGHFSTRPH